LQLKLEQMKPFIPSALVCIAHPTFCRNSGDKEAVEP
jgi:hypothetical protein